MRLMRGIFIILGFICFGLGAVGAIVPVLPTTPFLLVASVCFAKGSTKFNNWFVGTKLYKNHLDSFVKERAMPLKTKIAVLAFASCMLLIAFFMMNNIYGRTTILLVMLFKYYYFIFRIKTILPKKPKA